MLGNRCYTGVGLLASFLVCYALWFTFLFGRDLSVCRYFFLFQAEDGIRDWSATGVQTCALPISQIKLGGGEEKIARQHAQEKLTARERLALLIDEGTFTELGIHGRPHSSQRAMEGRQAPADGVKIGRASCRERV